MKTLPQVMNRRHAINTGGADPFKLTTQEREYLEAYDNLTPTQRAEMAAVGIYGPDLGQQSGPVNRVDDYRDPFAIIAAPQSDRYFDDPAPPDETRYDAAEAVLKVLYILTGSKHPGLRFATDCLLAIINRSDSKSQAEIARRYGITRAAVCKRMRCLRKGDLGGLEIYFFGGRPDVSDRARERATRVHRQRTEQTESWKPTQQLASLLANL